MENGTIVSILPEKGFGFIHHKVGQPDIFFHASCLSDGLEFGPQLHQSRVVFDTIDSERGKRAVNIRLAK